MGELRAALEAILDGPNVESRYECAHCGVGNETWKDDCPECGGVLMRIVTGPRDDDPAIPR